MIFEKYMRLDKIKWDDEMKIISKSFFTRVYLNSKINWNDEINNKKY